MKMYAIKRFSWNEMLLHSHNTVKELTSVAITIVIEVRKNKSFLVHSDDMAINCLYDQQWNQS